MALLIGVVSPHLSNLVAFGIFLLVQRIKKAQRKENSQEEFEELYLGPEMLMEDRYSQLLVTFYICLLYSSGMPMLYVISSLSFLATFYADKFFFIHFYRTPPKYYLNLV